MVLIFIAICFLAFSSSRLDNFGIDRPEPIEPFMNGKFQLIDNLWTAEKAFSDLVFNLPIWMKKIPNKEGYFITGKDGEVWSIDNAVQPAEKKLILDIRDRVFSFQDAGLLDIVFHPEFGDPNSENRSYIYMSYSHAPEGKENPNNYSYQRVSRFTVAEDLSSIINNSELILIQHFDQQVWHAGGALFFDNYGYLNISIGDEGGSYDEYGNSQKINYRLFGGILRIDVDQDANRSHPIRRYPVKSDKIPEGWPEDINQGYFIPNDNPWVSESEDYLEEFFIIGLRSPHTVFYDTLKDQVWVADVGQLEREEVNVMVKGDNGQWSYLEGTVEGPKSRPDTVYGNEVAPIHEYTREYGRSIIGGFIYRGNQFPYLRGQVYF